jgi:hypothetical protein
MKSTLVIGVLLGLVGLSGLVIIWLPIGVVTKAFGVMIVGFLLCLLAFLSSVFRKRSENK